MKKRPTPQNDASSLPSAPWAMPVEEVARTLDVAASRGLSEDEARSRRAVFGANQLREAPSQPFWEILGRQLRSLITALLAAAAAIAFVFGDTHEATAIAVVIVINTSIGFFTELRAVRSMEALRHLVTLDTRARRDGRVVEIDASELVPGDVVLLEAGDMVPADIRLGETSLLEANESALTGESLPVAKSNQAVDRDAAIADRTGMVFCGTAIARGTAEGIVVATGMASEIGRIAHLVETATSDKTPVEKRLDALGRRLVGVTIVTAAVIAAAGVAAGRDLGLMVQTAIALAVATVPEGLPIVATMALARGMWRMARRNALINRLAAVETLGSTTLICSDKTGTLTENRMTAARLALPDAMIEIGDGADPFSLRGAAGKPFDRELLEGAVEVAVLCNDAEWSSAGRAEAIGDPLEIALLELGPKAAIDVAVLQERLRRIGVHAFTPESRMMATLHEESDGALVAVKGAPEAVVECCASVATSSGDQPMDAAARDYWSETNRAMAGDGLRVLALARKRVPSTDVDPFADLSLIGLVGLVDPPRAEVRNAVDACRRAGIRIVMVTGDQAGTARAIAESLGLTAGSEAIVIEGTALEATAPALSDEELRRAAIFARVSPEQKLELVSRHQKAGEIVAMTGDGVNDAPALRKADIGIAMGQRGTQVAAEAADMVLRDDAFSSIVAAIEEGRIIYGNIKKFVFYLLSCNVSEVLVLLLAPLVGLPLPLTPLQILFLNLVTDVFPALALGAGEGAESVMSEPPRDPAEAILTNADWLGIGGYAALLTASVLGSLITAQVWLGEGKRDAVTISFLTLAFAQLWHVFNMRDPTTTVVRNAIIQNPWIWAALALCTILLAAAVYQPAMATALDIGPPTAPGWLTVAVFSAIPVLVGQVGKRLRRRRRG